MAKEIRFGVFFISWSFHLCVLIFHANVYTRVYKVFLLERMRNAFTACALCMYDCNPSVEGKKGVQVLQCNVYLSHKSKNKGKREERRMEKKSTTVFSCIYVYRFKCTRATMCAVIYISRKSKMLLPRDNDMQVLITNCGGGCTYTKIDSRFVLFVRAFF